MTTRWIFNGLNNAKQHRTINEPLSEWQEISNGASCGSLLGPAFNIFINNSDAGIENVPIKFADAPKLGGVSNSLEGRSRIQSDLDK